MSIPSNEDILALLAQLDDAIADALESEFLDFKVFLGPQGRFEGGLRIRGVLCNAAGVWWCLALADKQRGRAQAIVGTHGHDVDVFKRGIYDGTRPGIEAEVLELSVPEGTGKLLMVRVPEGQQKALRHGGGPVQAAGGQELHAAGSRVAFQRAQVASAALDWSGARPGVALSDLDRCSWSVPARCCAARRRPLACLTCQT